jgi:aryl-alcohol dehydrogenase-like predicted oxidoreductase
MQYARFGDTGLVVSRFGFGAMTFGKGEMIAGVQNRIGQEEADRMIGLCLDAGINLFDTADAYRGGETEQILGRALGVRRQDVVISTKVGFRVSDSLIDAGLSYRHIVHSAEESLSRLGTDWIDLYQLHIPDVYTTLAETARALEDLVRQGKVRYVGFSNFPAWKAARLLAIQERHGWMPIKAAQLYYSLLGRDLEHELVPFCQDAGIGILAWSPLASGFLTGKYTRQNPVPEGTRRSTFSFPPIDIEKGYEVVAALQEIANAHGCKPSQVTLAWTLSRPFLANILIGASRPEQLEENLKAAELRLAPEEIEKLDALTRPAPLYPGYMVGAMSADARLKGLLEGE